MQYIDWSLSSVLLETFDAEFKEMDFDFCFFLEVELLRLPLAVAELLEILLDDVDDNDDRDPADLFAEHDSQTYSSIFSTSFWLSLTHEGWNQLEQTSQPIINVKSYGFLQTQYNFPSLLFFASRSFFEALAGEIELFDKRTLFDLGSWLFVTLRVTFG